MSEVPLVPPGARAQYLSVPGGTVRVLRDRASGDDAATPDTGDATDDTGGPRPVPVLLLHGGGSDCAAVSWYELFETIGGFAPPGGPREDAPARAVYAPDLPGFGLTTVSPVGGPDRQAAFVADVADRLGVSRCVVVGVSMGGDVTLNLALARPDLVAALVLIAPGGLVPIFRNRPLQLLAWAASRLPEPVLNPLVRLANRHIDVALRSVVRDVGSLPEPVRREFAAQARRHPEGLGYRRYNQATLGPTGMRNNLLPVVARIAAPTLFFYGRDDGLVDPRGSAQAARRMPHARLVLVPECGHWAQLEASRRFAAELQRFLDDPVDPGRPAG